MESGEQERRRRRRNRVRPIGPPWPWRPMWRDPFFGPYPYDVLYPGEYWDPYYPRRLRRSPEEEITMLEDALKDLEEEKKDIEEDIEALREQIKKRKKEQ